MRIPPSLETLADHGIIQEVLRPLMSGKEAQIYLVISEDRECAAKIYKEAQNRSFKNRADYVEGRKVRNTRDQRAMSKGTKYGKSRDEDTWKSTEVDMIYRLQAAGVRVPRPHTFVDGVLVMELVADEAGNPAPRLGDLHFSAEEATRIYNLLIREVTRMLCAGVVHGDLSEFNVLLAADGPVVIDFPQAIDAAGNRNARSLLIRDVENLHRFYQRWVPGARRRQYAEEMWALYESNQLTPEAELTGNFKGARGPVDTKAVLELIGDANRDEARRRQAAGKSTAALDAPASAPPMRRREVIVEPTQRRGGRDQGPRRGGGPSDAGRAPAGSSDARRSGPPHESPRHASPRHHPPRDGPPHGYGRGSGGPGSRNGPPGHGARSGQDARRGPPGRQADGRRGPAGGRPATSGPKRGDSVQASTYVSPEARKNKGAALQLTPRNAQAQERPRKERHEEPEGQDPTAKRKRRRRRR